MELARTRHRRSRALPYYLGVDLGTSFTAAAVCRGRTSAIVELGLRRAQIPTVVHISEWGEVSVGETAERRALSDPEGVVRDIKRRVGDEVGSLVRGRLWSAEALLAEVLRHVIDLTTEREGEAPSAVALSHPVSWGPYKLERWREVARLAQVPHVHLVAEPAAAALHHLTTSGTDSSGEGDVSGGSRCTVVYDLGGGTFDVAVVQTGPSSSGRAEAWLVGEPDGLERLGGIDFDDALRGVVEQLIGRPIASFDTSEPRVRQALAQLRAALVEAKEALSTDTTVEIPLFLPDAPSLVRVTRAEFDRAIEPLVSDTMAVTEKLLASVELTAQERASCTILLVGGSSRVPLVSRLAAQHLGLAVTVDEHPKHAVALGAAELAAPPVDEEDLLGDGEGQGEDAAGAGVGVVAANAVAAIDPATDSPGAPGDDTPAAMVLARAADADGAPPAAAPTALQQLAPPARDGRFSDRGKAVVLAAVAIAAALIGVAVLATRGRDTPTATATSVLTGARSEQLTVRSIAFERETVEVDPGTVLRIGLTAAGDGDAPASTEAIRTIDVSSSDAAIAQANLESTTPAIKVVALRAGNTAITARSGDASATLLVSVRTPTIPSSTPTTSTPVSTTTTAAAVVLPSSGGGSQTPIIIVTQDGGTSGGSTSDSGTSSGTSGGTSGGNGPGGSTSDGGVTTTTTTTVVPDPPRGLTAGSYEEDAVTAYIGGWATCTANLGQSGGCDRWSATSGDSFRIDFHGTGITVYGAKAFNGGMLTFSVDGTHTVVADAYFDGNARRRLDTVPYYTISGLSPGNHTLTAVMSPARNAANTASPAYVTVDKIVVV